MGEASEYERLDNLPVLIEPGLFIGMHAYAIIMLGLGQANVQQVV